MCFSRLIVYVIAAMGLAACATAPASAPPSTTSSGGFARTLHLCDGDHISNAPAADANKLVLNFQPLTHVSGVTLARAPVRRGCFSSGFGPRHDRVGGHKGIDLSTGDGHAIYAGGDGVVEEKRTTTRYGQMILIRHNASVQTRYAHLSAHVSDLHVGHKVQAGEVIGHTGDTGNATAIILHYEIIVGGVPRDPMTVGH